MTTQSTHRHSIQEQLALTDQDIDQLKELGQVEQWLSGDKCAMWQGELARDLCLRYGQVRTGDYGLFVWGPDRQAMLAHRLIYLLFNGDFPPDKPLCLHKCEPKTNSSRGRCVALRHMQAGDDFENRLDMWRDGSVQSIRIFPRCKSSWKFTGSGIWRLLSDEQIRQCYDERTRSDRMERFRVGERWLKMLDEGRIFREITGAPEPAEQPKSRNQLVTEERQQRRRQLMEELQRLGM